MAFLLRCLTGFMALIAIGCAAIAYSLPWLRTLVGVLVLTLVSVAIFWCVTLGHGFRVVQGRVRFGIATAATALGGLLGVAIDLSDQNVTSGIYAVRVRDFAVEVATSMVRGAVLGAMIGVAVDLLANGIPHRSTWRFSLQMLMLVVAACAILCYGITCFVQVLSLKP